MVYSSAKKNAALNVIKTIASIVFPIITFPYVSRVLSVESIGAFNFSASIVNYGLLFAGLGVSNYSIREGAQYRENTEEMKNFTTEVFSINMISTIIVYLALLLLMLFQPKIRVYFWSILIMSAQIISTTIGVGWICNIYEDFTFIAIRTIMFQFFSLIATLVLVKTADDYYTYVIITAIALSGAHIVNFFYVRKKYIGFTFSLSKSLIKHIKPNLILFLPIFAISLYEVMDKIMLKMLCDVTQTGYYESANKIVRMPQTIFAALGTVMLPRISGMVKKESDRANAYVRDSLQFVVILASALMFGIALCSSRFIPFFYGDGYDACIDLLIMMTPIILFAPWKSVFRTQCLIPRKMDKSYIISVFLGAAVNLIVNMICIPHIQAKGAVIGTLVAEFVVCMYQTYAVSHILPIKTYLLDNWPFLACGFIMFIIVKMMDEYIPQGITGILAITLMGGGVYCFLSIGSYHFINKERYKHIKSLLLRKSM